MVQGSELPPLNTGAHLHSALRQKNDIGITLTKKYCSGQYHVSYVTITYMIVTNYHHI